MKDKILIVDDEVDNLDALERLFRKKYQVIKANSGEAALHVLQSTPDLALILSDQRMPQMTGVEFLKESLASHSETIRILLTGYTEIESVIAAVNEGHIYRYLTKPWDPVDLIQTVDQAVLKYQLGRELQVKNQQLEAAYFELQALDRAKSQFMILINHELKTPLTVILSYLQLLQESKLKVDDRHLVTKIGVGAERLREIIDDVLLLLNCEAGQLKLQKENIDLGNLVDEVIAEVNVKAKSKVVIVKSGFLNAIANTDAEKLKIVIRKLISNAIKFGTPNTPIQIEIAKDHLILSNEGPLLREELLNKIGKPFQMDGNIMNHSKGLGLGLSVSCALMKSMGGDLVIRASPGTSGPQVYLFFMK